MTNKSKVRRLNYKMNIGVVWCALVLVSGSSGDKWRWPDGAAAAATRIDNKLAFIDQIEQKIKHNQDDRQNDEAPFREPLDTEGFYNRPPGAGRFPMRVEGTHQLLPYGFDANSMHPLKLERYTGQMFDGTLDSLQYCKCLTSPDCNPRPNSEAACGAGKYLCCYKRPNAVTQLYTEFFNEVEDERPMLLPGRENLARPFPPPPGSEMNGYFDSYNPNGGPAKGNSGAYDKQQPDLLVGPGGPTGVVGPQQKPEVLVGPGGLTGIIGPGPIKDDSPRKFFDFVGDDRPLLFPGRPKLAHPFPPPPQTAMNDFLSVFDPDQGLSSIVAILEKEPQEVPLAVGSKLRQRLVMFGTGGSNGMLVPGRTGRRQYDNIAMGEPINIVDATYGRQRIGLVEPGSIAKVVTPRKIVLIGPNQPFRTQGFLGKTHLYWGYKG